MQIDTSIDPRSELRRDLRALGGEDLSYLQTKIFPESSSNTVQSMLHHLMERTRVIETTMNIMMEKLNYLVQISMQDTENPNAQLVTQALEENLQSPEGVSLFGQIGHNGISSRGEKQFLQTPRFGNGINFQDGIGSQFPNSQLGQSKPSQKSSGQVQEEIAEEKEGVEESDVDQNENLNNQSQNEQQTHNNIQESGFVNTQQAMDIINPHQVHQNWNGRHQASYSGNFPAREMSIANHHAYMLRANQFRLHSLNKNTFTNNYFPNQTTVFNQARDITQSSNQLHSVNQNQPIYLGQSQSTAYQNSELNNSNPNPENNQQLPIQSNYYSFGARNQRQYTQNPMQLGMSDPNTLEIPAHLRSGMQDMSSPRSFNSFRPGRSGRGGLGNFMNDIPQGMNFTLGNNEFLRDVKEEEPDHSLVESQKINPTIENEDSNIQNAENEEIQDLPEQNSKNQNPNNQILSPEKVEKKIQKPNSKKKVNRKKQKKINRKIKAQAAKKNIKIQSLKSESHTNKKIEPEKEKTKKNPIDTKEDQISNKETQSKEFETKIEKIKDKKNPKKKMKVSKPTVIKLNSKIERW